LFISGIINDRQNNLHSYLIKTANQIDQDLPMIINSETRLEYTETLSKNKFGYFYTLLLETADEIDIEEFANFIKPDLIINARTNVELFNFRYYSVTLVYFSRIKMVMI
jgi:hypothetical protein